MSRTPSTVLLTAVLGLGLSASAGFARQAAPVTDDALRAADPAEWLSYGRDYAETHYSPLSQINTENVKDLQLVWSYEVGAGPGRLEATPVVSNGVMYATGTWSLVYAIDARTGEEKWRWDPAIVRGGYNAGGPSACCGPVNRGVALYNGKVYVGLLDGRLVALDAETGRVVWARQTTPLGQDYAVTQAPRIVNGKVIIGNSGAEYGVRGYVTAYDAETGEQVWRTYTVPGNPADGFESPAMELAATTWTGEWWKLGGGGTVWDGMAYDPEANLLYIGTGNGSPWSREHRSPGGGDNLFLSSILALNPENGEIVWFYQTTPGDDWDFTATQNLILADLIIDGVERKVIMQAPKNGFFYVLDRITGEFISARPFTQITWATGVDPESGRPIEAPHARYTASGSWLSPGPLGAHNWEPMSFNPNTGLVYIPGQNNGQVFRRSSAFEPQPGRFNTGTGGGRGGSEIQGAPPNPPLPPGFLVAWDPVAQRERWRINMETGRNAGTLTTGGNLVFSGQANGRFFAVHAETGELLWETQVPAGVGTPMTYELDGRQYVSILAGSGGPGVGRMWTYALPN